MEDDGKSLTVKSTPSTFSVARKMAFAAFPAVATLGGRPAGPQSDKPIARPSRVVLSRFGRRRIDEGPDARFYRTSLAPHVDAVYAEQLRELLAEHVSGPRIFELGAGAHSYFPVGKRTFAEGVGLDPAEMRANKALSTYFTRDLNGRTDIVMPVHADYFNTVVCNATVPYLVHPEAIFMEMRRILAPGGALVVSFTNRFVSEKATAAWRDADRTGRLNLVRKLIMDPNPGAFEIVQVVGEEQPERPVRGGADPLYAVVAKMRRKRS